MLLFKKNNPYWALDISDRSLKLISLSKRKSGKFSISNYSYAQVPAGNFDKGKIVNVNEVAKLIKELVLAAKGPKIKSRFVRACLPERHTFIKLINIPRMTDEEIPSAVEWAAEHHLPFSLDEIYFDWQKVEHQHKKNKISVLIGAAPKDIVDSYTNLIKAADLTPLSLEIEAQAIARTLIDIKQNPTHEEAIGIIDLGASRSSFIIHAHNSIQSTFSLPLNGNHITETITEKLSLTPKQAEAAKIICGVDAKKCKGGIQKILEKELQELTNKIKSAITYYQKNFDEVLPIKKIILCGGGANMIQFASFLSENLNIPTSKGNPRHYLINKQNLDIPEKEILSYTTAIGLAIN